MKDAMKEARVIFLREEDLRMRREEEGSRHNCDEAKCVLDPQGKLREKAIL